MKVKTGLFAFAIFAFLFQSCQKELDGSTASGQPGGPVKPDTLTAGWSRVSVAGEGTLSDIFFTSPSTGFLVGSKIYKSVDSGKSWTVALQASGFFNIYMQNDSKGYFVEYQVWKTTDGGNSFTLGNQIDLAQDVFILNDAYSFATSYNGFYQSYNGGAWVKIFTVGLNIGGGYSSLFFVNNTTGWVVSISGIYRAIGGSVTSWQKANIAGGNGAPFGSVYALSTSLVYAANYNGQIYRSTDGGVNFSLLKQFGVDGFMDIHFLDALNGYASVDRFIFKTTDGGVSWNIVATIGQGTIHEIHFIDVNHGWACGTGGTVLIFKQ